MGDPIRCPLCGGTGGPGDRPPCVGCRGNGVVTEARYAELNPRLGTGDLVNYLRDKLAAQLDAPVYIYGCTCDFKDITSLGDPERVFHRNLDPACPMHGED